VPCAGICGTRCRCAMSKSCSPSAVWRRITRRSGVGCNDTVPNWNSDCGVILRPTNKSWRVDETYIRVQGRWCYLYRAIDSTGATIDFLLSALRDAAAAKRLFRQALSDPSHPQPRVINTDKARLYGSAIAAVKEEGTLRRVLWRRQRDENGQRVEHETRS
jgi:transposase-like protein